MAMCHHWVSITFFSDHLDLTFTSDHIYMKSKVGNDLCLDILLEILDTVDKSKFLQL